jgi:uncharacterized protein YbaR (Trm112 family)/SAM-dependent methyltransferase
MNLYDILACPSCKVAVIRDETRLICSHCQRVYPIINNVPILFVDEHRLEIQHEGSLSVRTAYDPWIPRLVIQSLPPNTISLDLGAGNMAFNLPHVIRMDVTLTPYVDVVADAHALPFLPGVLDFVFSLAVIEHLRQPFTAAQETYRVLRKGGYVYGECNFVYPYHGYPHHYFGTTRQGIAEIFHSFTHLRTGVATYQMPSFAVRSVIEEYKYYLGYDGEPDVQGLQNLLQQVLDQPLSSYDQRFSEEEASRIAAGVFYFGLKSDDDTSEVLPAMVQQAWQQSPALQQRFPKLLDLSTTDNIMLWAKGEAHQQAPELAAYLAKLEYFRKHEVISDTDLMTWQELPIINPAFGYIADLQRVATTHVSTATSTAQQVRTQELEAIIEQKNRHVRALEDHIQRLESGRIMRLLRFLKQGS